MHVVRRGCAQRIRLVLTGRRPGEARASGRDALLHSSANDDALLLHPSHLGKEPRLVLVVELHNRKSHRCTLYTACCASHGRRLVLIVQLHDCHMRPSVDTRGRAEPSRAEPSRAALRCMHMRARAGAHHETCDPILAERLVGLDFAQHILDAKHFGATLPHRRACAAPPRQ